LREPVSPDAVLAAVDDLTRETPCDRVAIRQLRRSLLTLSDTERRLGSNGQAVGQMLAVINRLQPAILGIDARGALVAASRGAQMLTGYDGRELAGMSVFDAAFGADLPLARSWQAHTEGRRSTGAVSVRDRAGRPLRMHTAIAHVLPGLDALALAFVTEFRT
jgi:PAS domain S-box-containing protein